MNGTQVSSQSGLGKASGETSGVVREEVLEVKGFSSGKSTVIRNFGFQIDLPQEVNEGFTRK